MLKKFMKNRFLVMLSIIFVVLTTFFGAKTYIERPQDLGSRLEYVGKSDYGCYFLCGVLPSSVYYFATDLNQSGLKNYFTKAAYVEHPNSGGGFSSTYQFEDLFFKPFGSDEEFLINFYDDTQAVIESNHLKQTNKQFIISIDSSHFMRAQDSL